ncbi:MAG: cell division FtsA domain-containing protein [Candidatus Paceibacterota bacterium]
MNFLKKVVKQKNEGKYILSLDVGTKAAKALVSHVDFEKDEIVNIGIGKSEQKTGNIIGGKIVNIEGVTNACREAIEKASIMAGTAPQEVIMGFSGNIVKVCTHTFEIARDKPQEKIYPEELKEIIGDIYRKEQEEIRRGLNYRERQAGIKLVSADIVDFSIDGYRVLNPLNFKGSRLRIGITGSYILSTDFDVVNEIASNLNLRLVKIAYGPYAVMRALGSVETSAFSAIMIDVGGNITDVVIVKNGNIQKTGMFILGGHPFTKRIANQLNISEKDAESLKIRYSRGSLSEEENLHVKEILSDDIDLWFSGVELLLREGAIDLLLPHRILFYGGGSQLPGIASCLNHLKDSNISFADKIKLDFIRLEHISDVFDQTNKLNNFQDITLVGLAHLYLDSVNVEDVSNNILAEIILKK